MTCADIPVNLFLVCPQAETTQLMGLISRGVKIHSVRSSDPKTRRIPTSLKLLVAAIQLRFLHKTSLFVGCDGVGNIVAALAAKLTSVPYVHYSLELPAKRGRYATLLERIGNWSYRQADLLITMDRAHADYICLETGVSVDRIALMPNSLRGPGARSPSDLLKRRLGLEANSVLILHAGGIGAAQASIPLAEATHSWPPEWHLVFHAHCEMNKEAYYQRLVETIKCDARIHLDDESLPPEELDQLVSSADIGLAWYDRELLGYRADLLGLAAGKIGRYLRNGIPVVVRDLPTIRPYIDKYHCGICVDRVDQIAPAIGSILSDHNTYSENALRCYEEVWRPDRHLIEIRRRVEDLLVQGRIRR